MYVICMSKRQRKKCWKWWDRIVDEGCEAETAEIIWVCNDEGGIGESYSDTTDGRIQMERKNIIGKLCEDSRMTKL